MSILPLLSICLSAPPAPARQFSSHPRQQVAYYHNANGLPLEDMDISGW